MSAVSELAAAYTGAGWKLCSIAVGGKAPKRPHWNRPGYELKPDEIDRAAGVGLLHAFSGTCALDLDDMTAARDFLTSRGVDVDALLAAPDAVMISSGRANRAKLLYRLDCPLPTVKMHGFELRCADQGGGSVQCVLPPTIHPETKRPYEWKYNEPLLAHWSAPPQLPECLRALWLSLADSTSDASAPEDDGTSDASSAGTADMARMERVLLAHFDPSCGYDAWLRVGMSLHSGSGGAEDGFRIWDAWSASDFSGKYKGTDDVRIHWGSFRDRSGGITAAYILQYDTMDVDECELIDAPSAASAASADDRVTVTVDKTREFEYQEASEKILASDLYVTTAGKELARIVKVRDLTTDFTAADLATKRDPEQSILRVASTEFIQRQLSARIRFVEKHARRVVSVPRGLATNIVGQQGWGRHLKAIKAIATAPFLRADGSVCSAPGYDEATAIVYAPNIRFPLVPVAPTHDDAIAAAARVLDPFEEFEFASPVGKSVLLAHMLTEAIRPLLKISPIMFYTANRAGSGKTLIASMVSLLVHGYTPPHYRWTWDGEEMDKLMLSAARDGNRTILFDNIPNGSSVESDELASKLTAPTIDGRVLGITGTISVPNKMVVVATGNNITPTDQVGRRSLVCRLNKRATPPSGWRIHPLDDHVREHRADLLVDLLTILVAYRLAGRTEDAGPYAAGDALQGFEEWSERVIAPILWLGFDSPIANHAEETNDNTGARAAVVDALTRLGFRGEFRSRQVREQADMDTELRAALEDAGAPDSASGPAFGRWFDDLRDQEGTCGNKLIKTGADRAGGSWRIRITNRQGAAV